MKDKMVDKLFEQETVKCFLNEIKPQIYGLKRIEKLEMLAESCVQSFKVQCFNQLYLNKIYIDWKDFSCIFDTYLSTKELIANGLEQLISESHKFGA